MVVKLANKFYLEKTSSIGINVSFGPYRTNKEDKIDFKSEVPLEKNGKANMNMSR